MRAMNTAGQRWVIGLVAALGLGCSGDPADSGPTKAAVDTAPAAGAGDEAPNPAELPPTWSVTLGAEGLELSVEGGPGGYWFGVSESAPGAWTGEDCVNGFTTADAELIFYCHDAGDGGKKTYPRVASVREMNEATTLFDSAKEGSLTYYLYSDPVFGGSGECWVQGADPAYYAAEGCQ